MAENFRYRPGGNYRVLNCTFNGRALDPGVDAPVREGNNTFTWVVEDEPDRPYVIFIESPARISGPINGRTTEDGDDNGTFTFRG